MISSQVYLSRPRMLAATPREAHPPEPHFAPCVIALAHMTNPRRSVGADAAKRESRAAAHKFAAG